MTDLDALRCATLLLRHHGGEAGALARAAARRAELAAAADLAGVDAWRRIAAAIRELGRVVPPPGHLVQ